MKRGLIKSLRGFLCFTVFLATNTIGGTEVVSIVANKYFQYDNVNQPDVIREISDISQVCFFGLDGLSLEPINLFLQYKNIEYDIAFKLGVTAIPEDEKTVFTYYYPLDKESSDFIYPRDEELITSVFDRSLFYDDEEHQAKYHSKEYPKRPHSHLVFDYSKEASSLYEKHKPESRNIRPGLCQSIDSMTMRYMISIAPYLFLISYLESHFFMRKSISLNNTKISSIDSVLRMILNIPRVVPGDNIDSLYQDIIRAAFIFNSFPEINCLCIHGSTITSGGSEDMDVNDNESSNECVLYLGEF